VHRNFIQAVIDADVAAGRDGGRVVTRFPPEPNGYLHIGHAKAICLNFTIAEEFGGRCNLRFDDTNPVREDAEYVESMKEDIRWLGFDWGAGEHYASDYFEQLFDFALELIEKGLAYVDDLDAAEMRAYRGTVTEPGRGSPHRERTPAENIALFQSMRAGEFPDGSRTLRAKIDMASPNMNLRDPVLYRILRVHHLRTGDAWCIYPMYDWAHGQSDAIEGVTHSLCSLEFENHRLLYDWFLDNLSTTYRPRQYEFARLNLTYTLTSKRKLIRLVEEDLVEGWDDPRMPTLSGLRRRGYTPAALREFCAGIGVAKFNSTVDMVKLENSLRDDLNRHAQRRLAVLRPLRVVIANYPEGETEQIEAVNNPEDEDAGTRKLPFSRTLYIDRNDFREEAPRKFFRLAPGREVRLRYAYCITCDEVVKDPESGEITELRCSYDPQTARGQTPDGRKVKGIIHWVSAAHAFDAEVRLYDHLFATPDPSGVEEGEDFTSNLNPDSLERLQHCKLEPSLADAEIGEHFQFERQGYFCVDTTDSAQGRPVFNRSVSLRDAWARIEKKGTQR
jgi:glutaminyl-tRNA synthetase